MFKTPTVSLIIPIYNELSCLRESLQHLSRLGAEQVIVVDGGSTDGSDQIVETEFPDIHLIRLNEPNRAKQMNCGASFATSNGLVFSPIDLRFPLHAMGMIRTKLQTEAVGGGFFKAYSPSDTMLRVYVWILNYIYFKILRKIVCTNAMFVKKSVFTKMGGFEEVDFMEDVLFSRKLLACGALTIIEEPVIVSSRRYQRTGVLRQILLNLKVLIRFNLFDQNSKILRSVYEGNTPKKEIKKEEIKSCRST